VTRPRIKDVAASAGVSASTVSVVLNGVPSARVSIETRRRVLTAADNLGYATSAISRSLRIRRTRSVGLVTDVIASSSTSGRLIQGAQKAADRAGHLLIMANVNADSQLEPRALTGLYAQQVDGIIYATRCHRVVELPAMLDVHRLVLLNCRSAAGTVPYAVPDEYGGALLATRELIGRGHRRIAFVTEGASTPAAADRQAGYCAALKAVRLPARRARVVADTPDAAGGYRAGLRLLTGHPRPTAVFCFNDRVAMGVYQAVHERGLRIPDDVSVVGFEDQPLLADALHPRLTAVTLPQQAMGEWAVRAMLDLIDGRHGDGATGPQRAYRYVVQPCLLVRRESVGPPR
jgi:LacI family transcriptional regulator